MGTAVPAAATRTVATAISVVLRFCLRGREMVRRKIAVPGALARRLHLLRRTPRQDVTSRSAIRGFAIGRRKLIAIAGLALAAIGVWFALTT
jgi:hypothetical protein